MRPPGLGAGRYAGLAKVDAALERLDYRQARCQPRWRIYEQVTRFESARTFTAAHTNQAVLRGSASDRNDHATAAMQAGAGHSARDRAPLSRAFP